MSTTYDSFFPDGKDNEWDKSVYYTFAAYLKTALMRNQARYAKRLKEKESMEVSYDDAENEIEPIDEQAIREMEIKLFWDTVHQHLESLSNIERQVVKCTYMTQLKDKDTAVRLGISIGYVSKVRSRALGKLRKDLGNEEHESI